MTTQTTFTKLTTDWNAEPNCPEPSTAVEGDLLVVSFYLNPYRYQQFADGDWARLEFQRCWRYRCGPTNDEGWYQGQCRFSGLAPEWGHFYEVRGDLLEDRLKDQWNAGPATPAAASRHFLFYFRDDTFECDAGDWALRVVRGVEQRRGRPTSA
jgi:hypothetical protein